MSPAEQAYEKLLFKVGRRSRGLLSLQNSKQIANERYCEVEDCPYFLQVTLN